MNCSRAAVSQRFSTAARPPGHGHAEVVDEGALVGAELQLVRALVDDVDPEQRQVRQDLGQRQGLDCGGRS